MHPAAIMTVFSFFGFCKLFHNLWYAYCFQNIVSYFLSFFKQNDAFSTNCPHISKKSWSVYRIPIGANVKSCDFVRNMTRKRKSPPKRGFIIAHYSWSHSQPQPHPQPQSQSSSHSKSNSSFSLQLGHMMKPSSSISSFT